MLHIVETDSQQAETYTTAFHTLGPESERLALSRYFTHWALGSLALGEINKSAVDDLIFSLVRCKTITRRAANVLRPLFQEFEKDAEPFSGGQYMRMETVIEKAAKGYLTTEQVLQEAQLRTIPEHETVASNGLVGRWKDGHIQPDFWEIEKLGARVAYGKVMARSIQADAYAYQLELVGNPPSEHHLNPQLLSGREHLQLGKTNDDGEFEPLLTILNNEHPAYSDFAESQLIQE